MRDGVALTAHSAHLSSPPQALWYTSRQRTLRALLVTPFLIFLVVLPVSLLTGAMTQINDAFCSPSNTKL